VVSALRHQKARCAGSGDGGLDGLCTYIVGDQPRLLFFPQNPIHRTRYLTRKRISIKHTQNIIRACNESVLRNPHAVRPLPRRPVRILSDLHHRQGAYASAQLRTNIVRGIRSHSTSAIVHKMLHNQLVGRNKTIRCTK